MAVYTQVSEDTVTQLLGICEGAGALVSLEGVAAGSINSTYRVTTSDRVFYLRVNEGKAMADLVYERDLLRHLGRRAHALGEVEVPRLVVNTVGGCFFKVAPKKHAMLFEELPGRELGVFELTEGHLEQVGAFLARSHRALRDYRGGRANPYSQAVVERWLEDLRHQLPEDRAELVRWLSSSFERIAKERRAGLLPRGVIHGDLFLNNTKWRKDQLRAVFDWEMAGRDHLALDLGIAVCAWCWRRKTAEDEAGFVPELVRALLAGYGSVRPLTETEQRGLYAETCFGALRFTASRVRDFEVPGAKDEADRDHLDYRDFAVRLEALQRMGARGFRHLVEPGVRAS